MSISWTLGLQSIAPLSALEHINSDIQIHVHPCPELAPLSASGNINSHIQASTILTIVTIPDARIPDLGFVRYARLEDFAQHPGHTSA